MLNLPESLRALLSTDFYTGMPIIEKKFVSNTDGSVKYLFRLNDGSVIESVLLSYRHGITACISSQVGCRMGCGFCASTTGGLIRHLSAGEMVSQVIAMQKDCKCRVSGVVVMGSGEPLDNFDNTMKFLELVSDRDGLNIGLRHITVSTCGLVPEILRLADSQMPVTLSVSLHAADDNTRKQLMPIAKKYKIKEVIDACKEYVRKTGRRVTFEYALISGVNDGPKNAERLAGLLSGVLCHVNIIPVNPVKGKPYRQPGRAQVKAFKDMLKARGINATVRRELGRDISGACGQLKAGYLEYCSEMNGGNGMKAGAATDPGRVRVTNQDYYYIKECDDFGLYIVADGMGGHNGGEVASRLSVGATAEYIIKWRNNDKYSQNKNQLIADAIDRANLEVFETASRDESLRGMGTTLSLALVEGNCLYIGHIGDSRIYLIRDRQIEKLTQDHSLVAELIKNGSISPEEGDNHPQKNIITRALGTAHAVRPDILNMSIQTGDALFLCTDGLTNMLGCGEIMDMYSRTEDPQVLCDELVKEANNRGGNDNITVIVAKVGWNS